MTGNKCKFINIQQSTKTKAGAAVPFTGVSLSISNRVLKHSDNISALSAV